MPFLQEGSLIELSVSVGSWLAHSWGKLKIIGIVSKHDRARNGNDREHSLIRCADRFLFLQKDYILIHNSAFILDSKLVHF